MGRVQFSCHAKAYLQKHYMANGDCLECKDGLIKGLKTVRDQPMLINVSVPAQPLT